MKQIRKAPLIGVAIATLLLAACNGGGADEENGNNDTVDDAGQTDDPGQVFNLTGVSYAIPGTDPLVMSEEWAERIETMTDGRITIEINPGGSLIAYGSEREGLTDGVIDISINAPMFFAGDEPAFGPWGLIPVAPTLNPERARHLNHQWVHYGGGLEIGRELYEPYDIHLIGTVHKSNEPLMATTPIESLEDLQGLQVRSAPGLTSELFSALGANPVSMGGGEIYSALDTGVVDAAEFVGAQENYGAGLHEVTTHVLYPGFHSPSVTGDVTIRSEIWDEMPEDLQLILEDSVRWLNGRIDHDMGVRDVGALGLFESEEGIEITTLSAEDLEEIQRLALEVTEAYRDESEMSARLIDSYLDHMRLMGVLE